MLTQAEFQISLLGTTVSLGQFKPGEDHARKLVRGLEVLNKDREFNATLCGVCQGHGESRQMYNAGCGAGYFSSLGACSCCNATGLQQNDEAAPISVVFQVLNKGNE